MIFLHFTWMFRRIVYCDDQKDPKRQQCQEVLIYTLKVLMSIVAPIAPFTCEDIYQFYIIDGKGQDAEFKEYIDTKIPGRGLEFTMLNPIFQNIRWPSSSTDSSPSSLAAKDHLMSAWTIVGATRDATKRQIELIRKDDIIQVGDDLEAKVEIIVFAKQHNNLVSDAFELFRDDLEDIFGTSEVKVRHIREGEASSGANGITLRSFLSLMVCKLPSMLTKQMAKNAFVAGSIRWM